jgi:hypothetical protein
MNRRIVVWLTVAADKEDEFNHWYEDEYIPRFVTQIPGIQGVTRWKIDGTQTYMTVYDLVPGVDFDDVTEALRSPSRDVERDAWREWEHAHLEDFRDGFFGQVYEYVADPVPAR